jgi:hypothetical protein
MRLVACARACALDSCVFLGVHRRLSTELRWDARAREVAHIRSGAQADTIVVLITSHDLESSEH